MAMSEPSGYLAKAEESLVGAASELAHGRYNNSVNRAYYACFQAAIAALQHASIGPRGGQSGWAHAYVQAEFVGRLIHQRKLYPERLRQVLARHLTLRHLADYAPEMMTYLHASRAVQRAHDFLAVIRAEVTPHAC
jgi:uncharacterized protein (UPF0332 family)